MRMQILFLAVMVVGMPAVALIWGTPMLVVGTLIGSVTNVVVIRLLFKEQRRSGRP